MVKWMEKAVWLLFIAIIGYLLIASIFSTCYIGEYSYLTMDKETEINISHTFYIRDNYLQHILVFIAFSCLLFFIKPKKVFENKYVPFMICIAVAVLSLIVVFASQYYPKFDQCHVMEIAGALNEGDFSELEKGGYLYQYPFQIGIVLYYRVLSHIFGNYNYVMFQAVNAIWIFMTYYLLVKITERLGGEKYKSGVAFLCLIFSPYLFFVTFLYGSVVGLPFALLSFYMMFLYEENPKISYLLICGLSMGIAVIMKSNYQIFLIAEVIYLLFSCFFIKSDKKRKITYKLLLAAVAVICTMLCKEGMDKYIQNLNHGVEVKGAPMMAWVALGLQDGKSAPGWHNGYDTAVFSENDYDYEKAAEAAATEVRRIIKKWPQDITTSISFFVKKTASQWNNPTFQSLWILENRQGKDGLTWLLQGNGRYAYIFWVNLLQTWILTGTLFYALFRIKKSSISEIVLPITFIGGFMAHMIIEAQTLTAMIYFPLLLPLCIYGYGEWRGWLLDRKTEIMENGWKSKESGYLQRKILAAVAAVVLVCILSYTEPFAKIFARNENTGAFDTYTQEVVNEKDALPEK